MGILTKKSSSAVEPQRLGLIMGIEQIQNQLMEIISFEPISGDNIFHRYCLQFGHDPISKVRLATNRLVSSGKIKIENYLYCRCQ